MGAISRIASSCFTYIFLKQVVTPGSVLITFTVEDNPPDPHNLSPPRTDQDGAPSAMSVLHPLIAQAHTPIPGLPLFVLSNKQWRAQEMYSPTPSEVIIHPRGKPKAISLDSSRFGSTWYSLLSRGKEPSRNGNTLSFLSIMPRATHVIQD